MQISYSNLTADLGQSWCFDRIAQDRSNCSARTAQGYGCRKANFAGCADNGDVTLHPKTLSLVTEFEEKNRNSTPRAGTVYICLDGNASRLACYDTPTPSVAHRPDYIDLQSQDVLAARYKDCFTL
jgi:hypothetical protein